MSRYWYEQPPIKGQPARGTFTFPADVIKALGDGDSEAGNAVLAELFLTAANGGTVPPWVGTLLGGGDDAKGQRVLQAFVRKVRRNQRTQARA
jgi:hypothetical protein